ELSAGKAEHEVPAPHVAAKLETLELTIDGAPGNGGSFPAPHLACNDAVAVEPLSRDLLGRCALVDLGAEHARHANERPSARPGFGLDLLAVGTFPTGHAPQVRPSLHDVAIGRRREVGGEPACRIGLGALARRYHWTPAQHRTQRVNGVVGDEPRAGELAERVAELARRERRRRGKLVEE